MTLRLKGEWWAYLAWGCALFLFVAPALISAPDTFLVLSGVVLCVLYALWTWKLWLYPLCLFIIKIIEEACDEL